MECIEAAGIGAPPDKRQSAGRVPQLSVVRNGKAIADGDTLEDVFDRLAAFVRDADRVSVPYHPALCFLIMVTVEPSLATTGDELETRIELEPESAPAK